MRFPTTTRLGVQYSCTSYSCRILIVHSVTWRPIERGRTAGTVDLYCFSGSCTKLTYFMQCAPKSLWVFSAWICKFCTWSRKSIQVLIYQDLDIHAVRAIYSTALLPSNAWSLDHTLKVWSTCQLCDPCMGRLRYAASCTASCCT